MRPSILVTGGAGYIGSHCCKAVKEAGFEPVIFDNLSTGHREFCRWGPLIKGDLRSAADVERAFAETRPVAVMHFAAQSIVPWSVTAPDETLDVNVNGTLNLLRAARRHEVKQVVFSSTCAVYGHPVQVPVAENAPLDPINPYGASKAFVERMLDDFGHAFGIRSVRLRYFNAAGADGSAMIGEWHDPETHLIPIVLDVAMGRRECLAVNGLDYPTPDRTAIRDYIHVEDLAEAHARALLYLLDGGPTRCLNLGTGRGASVLDVVDAVQAVTGIRVRTRSQRRREGDAAVLVADPSQAQDVLGWRAEHGLGRIVEDAWRWHRRLHEGREVAA